MTGQILLATLPGGEWRAGETNVKKSKERLFKY